MPAIFRPLLFICLICLTTKSWACTEQSCIKTNSWQLGVAIGLGVKTNPLVDGDNIPLVILPDIAWYGEKAYFDNGELGYQWLNNTHYALEGFIKLDQERAFFSFFHPANILIANSNIAPPSSLGPNRPADIESGNQIYAPESKVSIEQISKRKWAVNAGLRWHYFLDNMEFSASWQNDISGVHKGQIVGLAYSVNWLWHDTQFKTQIGADWKSAHLVDYYYGLDQKDTSDPQQWFEADAGVETYVSVNIQKPINKNWVWVSSLSYRTLPTSMTLSPLVEENNIKRLFMGVAYRF